MPTDVPIAVQSSEPVSLRISRRGPGVLAGLISLVLTVTGVLAMTRASEYRIPMIVVGVACWGGSLFGLRVAVRDLFGTLIADESGIRLRPRLCGIHLWWSEVSLWYLEGERRSAVFYFWKSGFNTPVTLPAKWLKQPDRERLTLALRTFAANKARRY
jgi:hypothetical protein